MRTFFARLAPAIVLLLAACTPAALPVGPAPAASIDAIYAQAIGSAAVYAPEHVLPLFPAVPDAEGNVRVVTLTAESYAPGTQTLGGDVWVTVVPEARDSCRSWRDEPELVMRLRQLLGLQPADPVTHFVEMSVPAASMFRPTVDPAVTTRWPCGEGQVGGGSCGLEFPAGVDPAHVQWMARQMLSAWQVPDGYPAQRTGGGRGALGYPWTRLGYTYNWHPGSPRYGASEYLVRGGATVRVDATHPIPAYCGRA